MDESINHYLEFDYAVRKLYDTIPLTDITSLTFGDLNSVSYFTDVLSRKQNLKQLPHSYFKIYDELKIISYDIKYYTALLYFFRPYITSSLDGTYFQSPGDRRYMMFASINFQTIYNFWDRIGDLLNIYFHTGLHDSSVYYSRVLNNFPQAYKASENYMWLFNAFDSEVKGFLGIRDGIVHSYQLECEFYWRVLENSNNISKLKEIQTEKESFPERFKRQVELTREAFCRAIKLIDELPDKESLE